MTDPAASSAFCVLPWIHSYFATDGQAAPCCISSGSLVGPNGGLNIQRDQLSDIFHSAAMDEVRSRLLAGEKISNCSVCWRAERGGGPSMRTHYNAHWQDKRPDLLARISETREKAAFEKPLSADFRFGNLCNLRCQICNTHNSSQIERDAVLSKWNNAHYQRLEGRFEGEWFEAPAFEEEISDFSTDIRLITLGGGEPSMSKPAQKWFSKLIERGQAEHIELRVSTNLTNVNPKFIDLVAQFGQPKVYLSIDGFGSLNDYLRYPSRWKIVERNADYLVTLAQRSNLTVYLTPVISAYNALSIVRLFEWAAQRNFDIIANEVRGVEAIDCAAIPDDARRLAAQRIRGFLKKSGPSIPSRDTIESLCRYLESPAPAGRSQICREKFHQFTHELDRDRNLRFEDHDPEMAHVLGYWSGSNSFVHATG